MSEKEKIAKHLFDLAATMTDAGGTVVGAKTGSKTADKVAYAADVTPALRDIFVESMDYVEKTRSKANTVGLDNHLTKAKLKISWTTFVVTAKSYKQTQNFNSASQCIAETFESAIDAADLAFYAATTAATGWTLTISAAKGVALFAQLYATKVACAKAADDAVKAIKKATNAYTNLSLRFNSAAKKFVAGCVKDIAKFINPDTYSYTALPKPARDELELGLLTPLRLYNLGSPIDFIKAAAAEKLTAADAENTANAVVLAATKAKGLSALTASNKKDAATLASLYAKLTYAAAFTKAREQLKIN